MKDKIIFYINRIKAGRLQEMKKQIKWIYEYGKHYWSSMIFYTLLGIVGTVISLGTSIVTKIWLILLQDMKVEW